MLQIIIIILAVIADQMTKFYITDWLMRLPGNTYAVIPNVVNFTYVKNQGMALGLFQGSQVPLIIITSIILIAGVIYLIKERNNKSLLFKISASLIVGGAIGNLIDRIMLFYVRDFIELRFIKFYIFNVSDSCTCVGAVLLAVYLLFFHDRYKKTLREQNE
jgi:signal peptidase II